MRLDRYQQMQPLRTRIRDWFRLYRHSHHPGFDDITRTPGYSLPFKHRHSILSHMINLRIWTVAYAPNFAQPTKRMQEVHKLYTEIHYISYRSMWTRGLPFILGVILITRFMFPKTFMNKGEEDSFETSWRDTHVINS